jgi:hypothetical protein
MGRVSVSGPGPEINQKEGLSEVSPGFITEPDFSSQFSKRAKPHILACNHWQHHRCRKIEMPGDWTGRQRRRARSDTLVIEPPARAARAALGLVSPTQLEPDTSDDDDTLPILIPMIGQSLRTNLKPLRCTFGTMRCSAVE